jgi:hypothetical protein
VGIESIEAPVRCAAWTRSQGADPVGTVGSYRAYLFVELPLPWPVDIGDAPPVSELRDELRNLDVRLQGLVPTREAAVFRVVCYAREGTGAFRRFARRELRAPMSDVAGAARALLADIDDIAAHGEEASTEILVCTHGRRDRCCGSLGTAMAMQLMADPDRLAPGVSVGRTSHTGGHRFAPTALVFPDGTGWAYVDADLLGRIVRREGSVTDVLAHYRGCSGLGSPELQAVERAVLGELGWDLFDLHRTGTTEPDGRVRLHVGLPDSGTDWEATVRQGRTLPVPDCGSPAESARKTSVELVVSDLRSISPAPSRRSARLTP